VDASPRATILASLRRLNRELGISVIYITHDLTPAHRICDSILVLYGGAVADVFPADIVPSDTIPQIPTTGGTP
jgi:ABC-type glutathione transport system ATPase component